MASTLDFQSDPRLIALTDALRAGPGSPQWRDAVSRLRAEGGDQADEFLLLCTAREHLASGRTYREVHAGPGFSRKVMDAVEQEGAGGGSSAAPTAGIVAILCALVVVGVVVFGYYLWCGSSRAAPRPQDLARVYFTEPVLDARLDAMPENWRRLGSLPLTFNDGLRPGDAPAGGAEFVGGALLWEQSVLASKLMQVEVTLRLPSPGSGLVAQVFVTDDPTFSDVRATSPHELAWTFRDGAAGVALASGRVEPATYRPPAKQRSLDVRIQFDAQSVAIATGGKPLWTGEHGLDPGKSRFVGIRFLAPAGEKADSTAAFESIRLKKPQP